MKNYKDIAIKVLAEISRTLLGVVFIFSGFVKAVDPVGGAIKIEDYLTSFGLEKLNSFSVLLSYNLSAIEFTLGVCMLLGAYRKYSSLLILIFMLFMTPLTLYLAIFEPVSDCGCFGDALIISNWQTFYKNVILLAAAIFTLIYNQRLYSLYTYKVYWFIPVFSYLFCTGFAYRNYNHLPILDFRPYKIGASIPELMAIPEDAPEDEYNFTFIYEKDGVQKEFTLENYPANDPDWTFVDSKMELIRKGYTPELESFNIYTPEGDDITEDILEEELVILIIAADLKKAKDDRIDEINHLYDYSTDHQIPFYCVTGSSEAEIASWSDNTGAEYPFLTADETLLKTMIRSNPGMILLKEGKVLMKWHYKDLPQEEDIDTVLSRYINGKEDQIGKQQRQLTTNLLTFTLPLLLVWGYDYLRNRRKKKSSGKIEPENPTDKTVE